MKYGTACPPPPSLTCTPEDIAAFMATTRIVHAFQKCQPKIADFEFVFVFVCWLISKYNIIFRTRITYFITYPEHGWIEKLRAPYCWVCLLSTEGFWLYNTLYERFGWNVSAKTIFAEKLAVSLLTPYHYEIKQTMHLARNWLIKQKFTSKQLFVLLQGVWWNLAPLASVVKGDFLWVIFTQSVFEDYL